MKVVIIFAALLAVAAAAHIKNPAAYDKIPVVVSSEETVSSEVASSESADATSSSVPATTDKSDSDEDDNDDVAVASTTPAAYSAYSTPAYNNKIAYPKY